jgi:16S rRNA (guanine966-N2)-methyltransferase
VAGFSWKNSNERPESKVKKSPGRLDLQRAAGRWNQQLRRRSPQPPPDDKTVVGIRIIGGTLRGRKVSYTGDAARTRPMKDRVREAVFNLIADDVVGAYAVDLFAGTGALGLEAISRGSLRATFIEQHFPTAEMIRRNIAALGVAEQCEVFPANTFLWAKRRPAAPLDAPWMVFCSPPYAFYVERCVELLELLRTMLDDAPPRSVFMVEADDRFDPGQLPAARDWQIRPYPPAVVAIYRKPALTTGA